MKMDLVDSIVKKRQGRSPHVNIPRFCPHWRAISMVACTNMAYLPQHWHKSYDVEGGATDAG